MINLSESTKSTLDLASTVTPVTMGATAAFTLNQAALWMTILAAVCSVVWFIIRLHDRIKYGPWNNE